jgi:hypothetical protein
MRVQRTRPAPLPLNRRIPRSRPCGRSTMAVSQPDIRNINIRAKILHERRSLGAAAERTICNLLCISVADLLSYVFVEDWQPVPDEVAERFKLVYCIDIDRPIDAPSFLEPKPNVVFLAVSSTEAFAWFEDDRCVVYDNTGEYLFSTPSGLTVEQLHSHLDAREVGFVDGQYFGQFGAQRRSARTDDSWTDA